MMTPLLLSIAISAATPVAQPATQTVTASAQHDDVVTVGDDGELSFFDKHLPFSLAENLHPELDDKLLVPWILTAFFGIYAGPLWMPAIADLDMDEEYQSEAIITWLVHAAIIVIAGGVFFWTGVGPIVALIDALYLYPVATINGMNRHVDGKGKRRGASKAVPKPNMASAAFAY